MRLGEESLQDFEEFLYDCKRGLRPPRTPAGGRFTAVLGDVSATPEIEPSGPSPAPPTSEELAPRIHARSPPRAPVGKQARRLENAARLHDCAHQTEPGHP